MLDEENISITLNCGYSKGYSVMDIIEIMKNVSGNVLNVEIAPSRVCDPAFLVADTTMLNLTLGKYHAPIYKNNIKLICEQAYQWELLKNQGKKGTLV